MTDKPVPRRLSIHDDDYDPEVGCALEIFLDGKPLRMCVSYDIDKGYALFNLPDKNGHAQLNKTRDGVLQDWVYGRSVEVRWKEMAA